MSYYADHGVENATPLGAVVTQGVRFAVVAHPGARAACVERRGDGAVHVYVGAPPEHGKANDAVLTLLAEALGIPRSRLAIVRGHSARRKLVQVVGLGQADALRRLQHLPAP
ncbi:MAG: DUF167 domain-containing protein [Dehalococcoidia bacterium]|nr:DUF167 domain-containing protein [Dehalococcoidia bacterium]